MDIRHFAQVIRRRWLIVTAAVLAALAAGVAGIALSTPQYQSKAQLFVSAPESGTDPQGVYQGSLFTQQRVLSYADIVKNPPVTRPVIDKLNLRMTPDELSSEIDARVPTDTVLVDVLVRDPSPHQAQAIAAAVGQQFISFVESLESPASGGGKAPVRVSVSRPASLPVSPITPRKKLYLAIALISGLLLGVVGALLAEQLDTSVKKLDDVATGGLTPLGVVPFDSSATGEPVAIEAAPVSGRAEAFRQIRTNLQFVDIDQPPRSLVVTSSVPNEGKSSTSCNLAAALAEAGVKTLLVDGDLRRPSVAKFFGLPPSRGLTEILVGHAQFSEVVIQRGETSCLSILANGVIPPNPSELLASRRMRTLLNELESEFDLVVIDAPPLLPVTDSVVLATAASGAVVVARHGKTRREEFRRAVEMLRTVDAHVFGTILNAVPTKGAGGYRYGYGYKSEDVPAEAAAART